MQVGHLLPPCVYSGYMREVLLSCLAPANQWFDGVGPAVETFMLRHGDNALLGKSYLT